MRKILCFLTVVFLAFSVSCAPKEEAPSGGAAQTDVDIGESEDGKRQTEVTLYFADDRALFLEEETRVVSDKYASPEEAVVSELIAGTQTEGLVSAIPEGTRLNSVSVEDGLCTVDLSAEFTANSEGGSASAVLSVYSVVNSLTALENVDRVMFLIDGKTVEVFANLIFDEPFEADESLNSK